MLFISKKCIPFSSISLLFLTFLTSVTSISISSNNALRPFPSPPFLAATIQNLLPVQEILQQFHYASAPFDFGSYCVIGSPKLGASANLTFLGITVEYTFSLKYFFTSSTT